MTVRIAVARAAEPLVVPTKPSSLGTHGANLSMGVVELRHEIGAEFERSPTSTARCLSPEASTPPPWPRSPRDQLAGRHVTEGSPRWAKVGGWRTAIFPRSLSLLMGTVFLLCVGAQSVAGWAAYNSEQLGQREDPVDWIDSKAAPGVQTGRCRTRRHRHERLSPLLVGLVGLSARPVHRLCGWGSVT